MQRRLEMILMFPPAARLAWPGRIALVLVACSVLPWAPRVVSAEPAAPAKASASALEQRLDRLEKLVESLALEVRALRDTEAQTAPAVVVKSEPATDAKDVDPGITEIRVTFSKDMRDGSWSWTQRSDETYPQVTGKPHYVDKRTCVLPVKLEPGKTYFLGINSPRFGNFKDASGRSAVPFALSFSTKP
jgi:RNA polymerase sigma-70 factor (ECF subfamily)